MPQINFHSPSKHSSSLALCSAESACFTAKLLRVGLRFGMVDFNVSPVRLRRKDFLGYVLLSMLPRWQNVLYQLSIHALRELEVTRASVKRASNLDRSDDCMVPLTACASNLYQSRLQQR